jgi:hypothetical protein
MRHCAGLAGSKLTFLSRSSTTKSDKGWRVPVLGSVLFSWRRDNAMLDKGKIEKLVGALRAIYTGNPAMDEKIRTEADYFARNAERTRYPKFRRQHLFVGSGVIEAGCNAECIVMRSLPAGSPASKFILRTFCSALK